MKINFAGDSNCHMTLVSSSEQCTDSKKKITYNFRMGLRSQENPKIDLEPNSKDLVSFHLNTLLLTTYRIIFVTPKGLTS